ncbi:hypothetical protein ACFS07_11960 [Undibacterium arcticum]
MTETTINRLQTISDTTPKNISGRQQQSVFFGEHGLHRIQWAGADVAIDDADGAQRQRGQVALFLFCSTKMTPECRYVASQRK